MDIILMLFLLLSLLIILGSTLRQLSSGLDCCWFRVVSRLGR